MKQFKVKTPNESFSGKRHGVQFNRGEAVAELNDMVKNEFVSWGYVVEEIVQEEEAPKPKKPTKKNEK